MSPREIRRKIKSIKNTRQITRAMQLVAASKMRRSQQKMKSAEPYAKSAVEVLNNLTAMMSKVESHPFWQSKPVGKIGLILVSPDRGLCGGMLSNLYREVLKFIKNQKETVDAVAVGKKGRDFLLKTNIKVIADFTGLGDKFTLSEIAPIAKIATTDFINGEYNQIFLIYTDFINTLRQKPKIKQILPLSIEILKEVREISAESKTFTAQYIFEPDPARALNFLLPRLVEIDIYYAILESLASEHSARMVAMKNATDNAGGLIADLTLAYNQARQSAITREIAEISSGAMNAM